MRSPARAALPACLHAVQATPAQKELVMKVNEALLAMPKFTDGELKEMGRSEYEIAAYHRDWEKKGGRWGRVRRMRGR